MGVHGPSPPNPDWARLDLRGLNSTRHAWGYISQDDKYIVSDAGDIYLRVEPQFTRKVGDEVRIVLDSRMLRMLSRLREWARVVKRMFVVEEEEEVKKERQSEPEKNLKLRRFDS